MPLYEGSMTFQPSQVDKGLKAVIREFDHTSPHFRQTEEKAVRNSKNLKMVQGALITVGMVLLNAKLAFAEANSEADLVDFLTGVGDFLINTVAGPLFIIGICLAGAAVIFGDTRTAQKFGFVALGGAIMLLSRALLDILERLTNF